MAKKKMSNFVSSHNGKWYRSGQCYAGAEEYLTWGLGYTVSVPGYSGAWQWGANWKSTVLGKCCTQVSTSAMRNGDICFWNNTGYVDGVFYGHVAMYYRGAYFGQNQGTDGHGGAFNLIHIGLPALALRPNFLSGNEPLTWVTPSTNRALTTSEMQNNAKCFYGYMKETHGWSLNACAGVLGNMEVESTINPNRSEEGGGSGFGLVQWTPGSVVKTWLSSRGAALKDYGNMECDLINSGAGYYSTLNYPDTWDSFKKSTKSASYLAMCYLANFERPANSNQPIRGTYATKWYNYLKDWETDVPDGNVGTEIEYENKLQLTCVNGIVRDVRVITTISSKNTSSSTSGSTKPTTESMASRDYAANAFIYECKKRNWKPNAIIGVLSYMLQEGLSTMGTFTYESYWCVGGPSGQVCDTTLDNDKWLNWMNSTGKVLMRNTSSYAGRTDIYSAFGLGLLADSDVWATYNTKSVTRATQLINYCKSKGQPWQSPSAQLGYYFEKVLIAGNAGTWDTPSSDPTKTDYSADRWCREITAGYGMPAWVWYSNSSLMLAHTAHISQATSYYNNYKKPSYAT